MGSEMLSERHLLVAERITAGLTPLEVATALGMARRSVAAAVDDLQRALGVFTLRSLSFQLVAQGMVPRMLCPDPMPLRLSPLTQTVWDALHWDILDVDLIPVLATAIRVGRDHVQSVIDQLCQTHTTSLHGLIQVGLAHDVLSVEQSVIPPQSTAVRPSPAGTGAWDPAPAQRRVLALMASGRDAAACARAEASTTSTIAWRTDRCKDLADVTTGRALIHEALRGEVLLRPDLSDDHAPAGAERAVWRRLPLDVLDSRLPAVIATLTGLSVNAVNGHLHLLRTRYRTLEGAVYAGWELGVIRADTPVFPPDRQPSPPLPAGAPRPVRPAPQMVAGTPMKLSKRQHTVLTLLTVGGMTLTEAAAHLKVKTAAVRANERSCLRRAEAGTLRALTHRSLSLGLLDPLDAGDRDPGAVVSEVEAVWRCLSVDVPDDKLVARISRMTTLGEARVQECLDLLRGSGLTDPQLIAAGWHRKLLAADPPAAAAAAGGPVIRRQAPPVRAHSPAGPRLDPLFLLPGAPPALDGDVPPWGSAAVAGQELDFVRVAPPVCRSFLTRIPVDRWGPVIGLPEARAALLVTKAGPWPVRRSETARLIGPGATVHLPGPNARTGPGDYWAVGPQAPLWDRRDLAWLLENSCRPMPALTDEAVR
ncbi:hypothetical protein ACFV1U_12745 [Streptomyces microflavus]|uniref:hypothetical protein n=1 Tax=Streptomyces microflavus TaxID=1919 RepID=UPI0036748BD5